MQQTKTTCNLNMRIRLGDYFITLLKNLEEMDRYLTNARESKRENDPEAVDFILHICRNNRTAERFFCIQGGIKDIQLKNNWTNEDISHYSSQPIRFVNNIMRINVWSKDPIKLINAQYYDHQTMQNFVFSDCEEEVTI